MRTQMSNNPRITSNNEQMVKRYVHQPFKIEHYGVTAQIQTNGKVILTKVAKVNGDEVEFDEIEIPASLIYKLNNLMKQTVEVKYVPMSELRANGELPDQE